MRTAGNRIFEPANRRQARGATIDDLARVARVDTAEGEDRQAGRDRRGEQTKPAWRHPTGLRRSLEDRSEKREIGPLIAGEADLFHAVRRSPDQERPAGQSIERAADRGDGETRSGEVDALRAGRENDVRSGVDQDGELSGAAERASVVRARRSRSLQPLQRTCSASTPAAARAAHQRRQAAPGTTAGLLMASRRGIFKGVAGAATQEQIEVVQTPDQVEKAESGDDGTRPGGEQELAQGTERQQERGVIPGFEPGRQEEKQARLHAVDEEDSAEERISTHGRVDCSPPAQPATAFGALLTLAVVLLGRWRGEL